LFILKVAADKDKDTVRAAARAGLGTGLCKAHPAVEKSERLRPHGGPSAC